MAAYRFAIASSLVLISGTAAAQYPPQPQPQPYPQQPYPQPQPQYQPQPYPQPYPQPQPQYQPQPYPQQPYPQQPYPQQPYPYQPQPSPTRGAGEMTFLYVTGGMYGVGSGIWIDALAKVTNPGPAIIMPLVLGAAVPIGVFLWDDQAGPLHRGVPASIATGLSLGAVEGIAIAGTQWQYTREKGSDWSFATQTTVTWIFATGGGVGGWAFGEWLRPDPRSMGFIAGGSAWGALSGAFLGIAVSGKDWKDGASVAGLIGYNVGIAGGGALSVIHTPSWNAQRNMWIGYGLGALAGCLVFPFYLGSDSDAKGGFFGPAVGGLAGLGIAGALSYNMKDPEDLQPRTAWKAPFDVGLAPLPRIDGKQLGLGSGPIEKLPQPSVLTATGTF